MTKGGATYKEASATSKRWRIGCLGIFALMLAAIGAFFVADYMSTNVIYQKVTIVIDTPDGKRDGSAVTKVTKGVSRFVPGFGSVGRSSLRGEAALVEVSPGRYLFALLGGMEHLAQKVFAAEIGLDQPPRDRPDSVAWSRALSRLRLSREIPANELPLLITFDDLDDPATVKRVDPDNLEAVFGPGVSLNSFTLEITDEPVTTGEVEKVLGWLDEYYNKRLDGNRYGTVHTEDPLANSLSSGAFRTWRR